MPAAIGQLNVICVWKYSNLVIQDCRYCYLPKIKHTLGICTFPAPKDWQLFSGGESSLMKHPSRDSVVGSAPKKACLSESLGSKKPDHKSSSSSKSTDKRSPNKSKDRSPGRPWGLHNPISCNLLCLFVMLAITLPHLIFS